MNDLKDRTKKFALRIINLVNSLPNSNVSSVIAKQLARSGTSVAANYRAACRAKSPKDFIYKLDIVEEETDETLFWIEMIVEAELKPKELVKDLMIEAEELLSIWVSSKKTAKKNLVKN
ncbi:MAG: four helix bundle protein [Leadbetterella sp.]